MTTDELEGIIRDELRAEAARTPNGQATRNAVLLATENLAAGGPGLRRWLWPALAAAAVVLLVVGSIVVPKLLQSKRLHSTGRPSPVPTTLFAVPKMTGSELNCATLPGGRLVNGLQTSYAQSGTGDRKYVFEYHCLGSNGVRSVSVVQVFSRVNGVYRFLATPISTLQNAEVISFNRPTIDGISARVFDRHPQPGFLGMVDGAIETNDIFIEQDGSTSYSFTSIAVPCVAEDRSVAIATGPTSGELVLRLTNDSSEPCALEGYPKLVPTAAGKAIGQALTGTLNGPAGGVTKADVTPIIELQPGQSAAAIIEQTPRHPSCPMSDRLAVTLPNGIAMGSVPASVPACGVTVHPFVNSPSGSD